jgi:glutaminyl-peptide cyclotransferase
MWVIITALLAGIAGFWGCATYERRPEDDLWRVKVVAAYPHDVTAFTQGLAVYGGRMYEGTGRYGASSLRCVDITTGTIERMVSLDKSYFGEGITVLENRIYQFTWRNDIAIVYDADTFTVLETLRYGNEAWGVTHDGTHLIVSDGTATIRFLDPRTLQRVKQLTVHSGVQMVDRLNELEYVQNEIWANIWYKDRIARISPADGKILGWIDLNGLYPHGARGREDVLNGIAYDAVSGRVFVTGKNWPRLYEIEVLRP